MGRRQKKIDPNVILIGYIRIWEKYSKNVDKKRCEIIIPKNQLAIILQKMVHKKLAYNLVTSEIR